MSTPLEQSRNHISEGNRLYERSVIPKAEESAKVMGAIAALGATGATSGLRRVIENHFSDLRIRVHKTSGSEIGEIAQAADEHFRKAVKPDGQLTSTETLNEVGGAVILSARTADTAVELTSKTAWMVAALNRHEGKILALLDAAYSELATGATEAEADATEIVNRGNQTVEVATRYTAEQERG